MTGSTIAEIRDVVRRYNRALQAGDAAAVAQLYCAYGAHFPGRHPEAFGTDIEERYRWLFRFEPPLPGHILREVVPADQVTVAVTEHRHHRYHWQRARHLFVLTDDGGQWKILASLHGSSTLPADRAGEDDPSGLLQQVRARLSASHATTLAPV
ncbi:nuclear transport factor 2 family protein [Nocardia veterana]|uniref:Nuclear transport factor 2 family protein n=1 Tax=Nocardia veterana TaxID=132249 RepID=A0A7X6RKN0_9NOCA|nr:nuclear transport factor 2 family protein [Nocardia veterana]NKY89345.1 nuclear transport factor 2 family protein [Nocardia veterana]